MYRAYRGLGVISLRFTGFRVWGLLGFRVEGFRVLGSRVSRFRVWAGLGFSGLGFPLVRHTAVKVEVSPVRNRVT